MIPYEILPNMDKFCDLNKDVLVEVNALSKVRNPTGLVIPSSHCVNLPIGWGWCVNYTLKYAMFYHTLLY